jgi:hypothetical protein
MTKARRDRDLTGAIGCALLIAVGAAAIWFSRDFSALGAVFPRTVGGLMVTLAVVYIGLVARGRTARQAPLGGSPARRVVVAGVMLAWGFLLEPLGFLPSSTAAFVVLLAVANHDRWTSRSVLVYGLSAALLLGALYGLFKQVLLVPLP